MEEEWEVVCDVFNNECNLASYDYPIGSKLRGVLTGDKIYLGDEDRRRTSNFYIPRKYCVRVKHIRRGGE